MLKYELKRLFTKRLNAMLLMVIVLLAVVFVVFAARNAQNEIGDSAMNQSLGTVRSLSETKNQWRGELTPEVLVEVASANQKIDRRYGDSVPDDVYEEILLPSLDLTGMMANALDWEAQITPKQAKNFYKLRQEKISETIKEYGKNAKQQAFLKEQYAKIDTPFYYEAADSWKSIIKEAEFYGIVIALLIGFFATGIFADEFRLQADSVYFATRHGRTKATWSKIGAGILMATIVYGGAMLLFSGIAFAVMGVSGAGTLIQIEWVNSIYTITYGQEYLLVLVCGYIASLLSAAITMLISAKTHAAGIAVCVPFVLFCVLPFLARALDFSTFTNLIPQRLFFLDYMVREPILFQIGGLIVRQIPFVMMLYMVVFVVFVPFIYCSYHRYTMR